MAHDEHLAQRIRVLLDGEDGVAEQRMFGGPTFLVGGHMAVAASGRAACGCARTRPGWTPSSRPRGPSR